MARKKVDVAEIAHTRTDRLPTRSKAKSKKVRDALMARLVASEYLRNGLNMKAAFESVAKQRYSTRAFHALVNSEDGAFLAEIDTALKSADIEKNKVLGLLWAHATASPLDFMDDDGVILSVAELKQLPRELKSLIEEIKVTREEVPVKDEAGKVIRDEEGKPKMRVVEKVHLKFPSKQGALNTIAQIGKLIGPSVVQNNYNYVTNIGQAMMAADNRRAELLASRGAPARVIEHAPADDDSES